ncbi:hypothetical protein AHAS_Ahas17G0214700 [Arachis hypogaea]
MQETGKIGGKGMEEVREVRALLQGNDLENREVCLLSHLKEAIQNLKRAKGKCVKRPGEVTQKEKVMGVEKEMTKGATFIAGPSNWKKPKVTNTKETIKQKSKQEFTYFQEANIMDSSKELPSGPQTTPATILRGHNIHLNSQGCSNHDKLLKTHHKGSWRQESKDEKKENDIDLKWTMREEIQKRINVEKHKEKQCYKNNKRQIYYVELAPNEEEKESKESNQVNNNLKIWEEVLSIGMQHNLKTKRKREENGDKNITKLNWEEDRGH